MLASEDDCGEGGEGEERVPSRRSQKNHRERQVLVYMSSWNQQTVEGRETFHSLGSPAGRDSFQRFATKVCS